MSEQTTISFVATPKLKRLLEAWAKEEERSVSFILRKILQHESQRRTIVQKKQEVFQ